MLMNIDEINLACDVMKWEVYYLLKLQKSLRNCVEVIDS